MFNAINDANSEKAQFWDMVYESFDMKDVSLLVTVIIAFLLFVVGLFIPGRENPWHIIFVTLFLHLRFGALLLFHHDECPLEKVCARNE